MARAADANAAPPERTPFNPPRRRALTRTARLAGMLLLVIWLGPVSFVQDDGWQLVRLAGAPRQAGAAAEVVSDVIPAGRALLIDPGTHVTLRLKDGTRLEGHYLGRALLDSATYAPRFEARSRTSSYAPFALGETLHVALRDGREWTAPFAGYAEQSLLLQGPDGRLRVPFEFTKLLQHANGGEVATKALSRAFHDGLLPSAEALTLEEGPSGVTIDREVAIEDIASATVTVRSSGTNVAGIIVVSVLAAAALTLIVIALTLRSSTPAPSGCTRYPTGFFSARVTTRPFDRCRACFVGDPLAAADPWPGAAAPAPAAALAAAPGAVDAGGPPARGAAAR